MWHLTVLTIFAAGIFVIHEILFRKLKNLFVITEQCFFRSLY